MKSLDFYFFPPFEEFLTRSGASKKPPLFPLPFRTFHSLFFPPPPFFRCQRAMKHTNTHTHTHTDARVITFLRTITKM